MYEYQKHHKYFAAVTGSLEKHCAEELSLLGAEVISETYRGLRFSCDQETLYRILYCSRLAQRILAPLMSFQCHSEKYLYTQAQHIDWTSLLNLNKTFSIITNVHNSYINNSLYAGQVLKDAICDQFKTKYQQRPNFKPKDGDTVLSLYIADNWATISLDLSGTSLHKRGYRTCTTTAPLQETLAAAIIKLSGWGDNLPTLHRQGHQSLPPLHRQGGVGGGLPLSPLHDPMCGSGTILAEALMKYCQIPAGYLRTHNHIKNAPDFDQTLWEKVVSFENSKITPLPKNLISGSDIDPDCIDATKTNLQNLPYSENVSLAVSDFRHLPAKEHRIIICNPPYGLRLGKADNIANLYNDLGDFLKQKCTHSEAYILIAKSDLISALRLRVHWKKTMKNGDLETKLVKILIK